MVEKESKKFPIKIEGIGFSDCTRGNVSDHSNLKILSPKQILQRLPIALAQVKAGNTSENLNEIRQIIHFLYKESKVTRKSYNNIMNSIKL